MQKFSFLFVTPPLVNDEKKYSINKLIGLGYTVDVLDLTYWLNPNRDKLITQARLNDPGVKYIKVCEEKELEEYSEKNALQSFFLPMFDDYYEVKRVYRIFAKYDIRYGYVNNLAADFDILLNLDMGQYINRFGLHHLRCVLYNRIIRKMRHFKAAEFICFGTQNGVDTYLHKCRCDKKTKMLYVHTYDYERYIDVEVYDNAGKEYCVFLDQYLPYHTDNTEDANIKIDPEQYYSQLESIFRKINETYGMEVIIAAHPRSDYSRVKHFEDYKIVYGKTAELVKGAKLVLGHFSTTIGLTALSKTPIAILAPLAVTEVELFKSLCYKYCEAFEGTLIKSEMDVANISFQVNQGKYESYAKTYMTCNYDDKVSIWERVTSVVEVSDIS